MAEVELEGEQASRLNTSHLLTVSDGESWSESLGESSTVRGKSDLVSDGESLPTHQVSPVESLEVTDGDTSSVTASDSK